MKLNRLQCFQSAIIALLALAIIPTALASRQTMSMGYYIGNADTIVLADTKRGEALGTLILTVREVIKGEEALAGQSISIRFDRISTADAYVPFDTNGIAVLLRPDWRQSGGWPVLQCYQSAEEIQALRILTKICPIKNERERLLALRGTIVRHDRFCEMEIFAQLRHMRAVTNFDVLTNLYPIMDTTNQVRLVELIGDIGDLRGVPTLIVASESPDHKLSDTAIRTLGDYFPGAPGVNAALERALGREDLARVGAYYLSKGNPDPRLKNLAQGKVTWWLKAHRLSEEGKANEARTVYFDTLVDDREPYRTRLDAASELVNGATATEQNRIRQALVPLFANNNHVDDYLLALQSAKILRSLRHPDCLPGLLNILKPTSFTHSTAAWTAATAIRELGPEARRQAVAQITEALQQPPPRTVSGEYPLHYPLELLWLGSQKEFGVIEARMHPAYRSSWQALRPLQGFDEAKDETSFLIQHLSQPRKLPGEATEWILMWLGDVKDKRAIPVLAATIAADQDWSVTRGAADALVSIGGREAEEELTKLMKHDDENRVRRHATEAVFTLLGKDSGAMAWRVLNEKNFGWRTAAYSELGRVGTTNDLKLLLPLSDYWTGDWTNHYWAMSAVRSIRGRYGYDLNGPIKPPR